MAQFFDEIIKGGVFKSSQEAPEEGPTTPNSPELLTDLARPKWLPYKYAPAELESRISVQGFAIDAEHSPDRDDLIGIRKDGDSWLVDITISDVDSIVAKGSGIDTTARVRRVSRYHDTKVRHMLPERLAVDMLSMHADEVRPGVTISIPFSSTLEPGQPEFALSAATTSLRMTYEQAGQSICSGTGETCLQLRQLHEIAQRLNLARKSRGASVGYDQRTGLVTTESGKIVHLSSEKSAAYLLISELMILMNHYVAKTLWQAGLPALYRNYQPSSSEVGMRREIDALTLSRRSFNRAFHSELVSLWAQLKGASYGTVNEGHFSLGLEHYCHATSPVRRYTDLVNQRILKAWLSGTPSPYSRQELDLIAHENRRMKMPRLTEQETLIELERIQAELTRLSAHDAALCDQSPPQAKQAIKANRSKPKQGIPSGKNSRFRAKILAGLPPINPSNLAELGVPEECLTSLSVEEIIKVELVKGISSMRFNDSALASLLFETPAESLQWREFRAAICYKLEVNTERSFGILAVAAHLKEAGRLKNGARILKDWSNKRFLWSQLKSPERLRLICRMVGDHPFLNSFPLEGNELELGQAAEISAKRAAKRTYKEVSEEEALSRASSEDPPLDTVSWFAKSTICFNYDYLTLLRIGESLGFWGRLCFTSERYPNWKGRIYKSLVSIEIGADYEETFGYGRNHEEANKLAALRLLMRLDEERQSGLISKLCSAEVALKT